MPADGHDGTPASADAGAPQPTAIANPKRARVSWTPLWVLATVVIIAAILGVLFVIGSGGVGVGSHGKIGG